MATQSQDRGFQSTHPLRGATASLIAKSSSLANFNPRTPCGVRHENKEDRSQSQQDFNPRTPCGVRLASLIAKSSSLANFNPRTPCGVRLPASQPPPSGLPISIHAPLAGCDWYCANERQPIHISIHAPLAGCDAFPRAPAGRRGTDFNPRTPCGVRQQNCRNIPGKFAQKLQNFCKAEQRAALPRVGQRESGCYFRPCAVRTSRGKPEHFRFASDNERALRSVARLCAEVLDAGFILVSKVIKA